MQDQVSPDQNVGAGMGATQPGQPPAEAGSASAVGGVLKAAGGETLPPQPDEKGGGKEQPEQLVKDVVDKEEVPDVEPAIEDTATAAALLAELNPDAARSGIELLAKGNNMAAALKERVSQLKKEGRSNPEKMALALDLEIAGLRWRRSSIEDSLNRVVQKARQSGKIPPELAKLKEEVELISEEITGLQEQRNKGEVKLIDEQGQEETAKIDLSKEKNQVRGLARALGVKEEIAESSPLYGLQDLISQAIENGQTRKAFIENMRKLTQTTNEVGEIILGEDEVQALEDYLNKAARNKTIEKGGKKVIKGAGMVGLFGLLMAWLASKDKQRGG